MSADYLCDEETAGLLESKEELEITAMIEVDLKKVQIFFSPACCIKAIIITYFIIHSIYTIAWRSRRKYEKCA